MLGVCALFLILAEYQYHERIWAADINLRKVLSKESHLLLMEARRK